jgi:hypothetical protein
MKVKKICEPARHVVFRAAILYHDSANTTHFSGGATMAQVQRLGDLLVEAGAITQEQLSNALAEQKKSGQRLGAFLVSKGWITESKLMEALSLLLKFPLVSLSRYRPSPEASEDSQTSRCGFR